MEGIDYSRSKANISARSESPFSERSEDYLSQNNGQIDCETKEESVPESRASDLTRIIINSRAVSVSFSRRNRSYLGLNWPKGHRGALNCPF